MDRDWLATQLANGRSLEDIGREVGRDGSTVAYWARKHGLRAAGTDRFSARGAPDRLKLEALVAEGRTLREIAAELDRSIATVRHWLGRWSIERVDRRQNGIDPVTAEREVEMTCLHHGRTIFTLETRGSYRCKQCRQEAVTAWRRRLKRKYCSAPIATLKSRQAMSSSWEAPPRQGGEAPRGGFEPPRTD